ncbi:MAG TPA: Hsp20/alpha crystallin family protein [Acetobacteraceae bacterium]|nr:Hsp20/alpha crystallin family protein [Acetobacteraceae bacterium]
MGETTSNGSGNQGDGANAGPVFVPPADIIEKGDTVIMLLDLPGADPESLDVTLDKRVLTIVASVKSSAPEGYAPVHIEFRDGTYERRFIFSDQMDGEHIDAVLKDGVLRLTVPKAPETSAKKIAVSAA